MALKGDYNKDGKVNKKDDALKAEDLNGDGFINKKDRDLKRDNLSMSVFGKDYQFASRILSASPELQSLFKEAIAKGWEPARFQAAIQNSKWYSEQGSDFAREAWLARAGGGEEWENQLVVARDAIQRQASNAGVQLAPDELDSWAERYLFEGWYDQSRQGMLMDALAERVDVNKGQAASRTMDLQELARKNGLKMTESFFVDANKSIMRGESTMADWEKYIRDESAKRYPLYADKVKAGVTVEDLAAPYRSRMADILELDVNSISLEDPYIRDALNGVDEKGNPVSMNYSEFETKLRRDPRWESTKQGKTLTMGLAENMMRSWGFLK